VVCVHVCVRTRACLLACFASLLACFCACWIMEKKELHVLEALLSTTKWEPY
jgi:hypothetical protein